MAKFQVTWINEHTGEVFDTLDECKESENKYEEAMKEKEAKEAKEAEKEEDMMSTEDAHKMSTALIEFQKVWDAFQFAELVHSKNEHITSGALQDLEKELTNDARKTADKFREKWGDDIFLSLMALRISL